MSIITASCDKCGLKSTGDDFVRDYEGRDLCRSCRLEEEVRYLEYQIKEKQETIDRAQKEISEVRAKIDEVKMAAMTCRRCGIRMVPGKVLRPSVCIHGDDVCGTGDGATRSEGFSDGKREDCLKCPECGHSVVITKKSP
jgi:hypothetical protein